MAARIQTELITLARAAENRIYLLTANRVGKERWGEFCGWSQIVDPYGTRLAEADETEEALLVADVELEKARDKDYVDPRRVRAVPLRPPPSRAVRRAGRGGRARSKPEREERAMAKVEETFTWKALLERDGLKVSKSPWGPDDEIGRLNWITPDTNRAILEHLDGSHVFDLNVEYFIGMPSWVAAGDPPYGIWMTHTPQGSINDNLSGVGPTAHEKLLVLRRLDPPVHPLRDARRHAQPPRPPRDVLERVDGGQGSRQPHLEQGRPRQVPADHRPRPCCSTSRG